MQQAECLSIGSILAERYKLLARTGLGSCAWVYRAEDLQNAGRAVAVKVLHQSLVAKPELVLRFQQECEALAMLSHPNILRIEDYGIAETSQPFLVSEFVDGTSLDVVLEKEGRLPLSEALDIAEECCALLMYAHEQGIIHRDLKPSNIMLQLKDGKRTVKLVDFGFSKLVNPDGESLIHLTVEGEVIGTPLYMSPEQCLGRKLDGRSDVYSLACVLYQVLCGKPPVGADTPLACMSKHLKEAPPSFREVDPTLEIPEHVEEAIFNALAKNSSDRPSARDFGKALSGQVSVTDRVLVLLRGFFKSGKPNGRGK